MTYEEWFEGQYPKSRYGDDAELFLMREEYRYVWDAAAAPSDEAK
jgi:hypothetical protein